MARHNRIDPAELLKKHFAAELTEERGRPSPLLSIPSPFSVETDKFTDRERTRRRRRATFEIRDAAVAALLFVVLGLGATFPKGGIGPSLHTALSTEGAVTRLGTILTYRLSLARKAFIEERSPALPRGNLTFRRFR